MSGNTDIVSQRFNALAEGGVDALLPLIDDDFEVTTPSSLAAEPDTYHRGPDGVRRWFNSFYEAMDEVRIEQRGAMQEIGDEVLVPFKLTARGRATQLEFSQDAVALWRVVDGKGTGMRLFTTVEDALAAAAPPE